jgi:hypothetical protein
MALIDPSGDTIAQTTDYARNLIARATLGNVVFKVVGFGLGRGGYDPSDVVQPLPLTLSDTELTDKVFPSSTAFDYEPLISTEEPTMRARVYNCRVGSTVIAGDADYALGELALYGEIIKSDDPLEIGQVFMFALSHFPILCKTRRDTLLRRVVVTY